MPGPAGRLAARTVSRAPAAPSTLREPVPSPHPMPMLPPELLPRWRDLPRLAWLATRRLGGGTVAVPLLGPAVCAEGMPFNLAVLAGMRAERACAAIGRRRALVAVVQRWPARPPWRFWLAAGAVLAPVSLVLALVPLLVSAAGHATAHGGHPRRVADGLLRMDAPGRGRRPGVCLHRTRRAHHRSSRPPTGPAMGAAQRDHTRGARHARRPRRGPAGDDDPGPAPAAPCRHRRDCGDRQALERRTRPGVPDAGIWAGARRPRSDTAAPAGPARAPDRSRRAGHRSLNTNNGAMPPPNGMVYDPAGGGARSARALSQLSAAYIGCQSTQAGRSPPVLTNSKTAARTRCTGSSLSRGNGAAQPMWW